MYKVADFEEIFLRVFKRPHKTVYYLLLEFLAKCTNTFN